MLLTRSPLIDCMQAYSLFVRLACIRHAASVHPEPGSNSSCLFFSLVFLPSFLVALVFTVLFSFQRS